MVQVKVISPCFDQIKKVYVEPCECYELTKDAAERLMQAGCVKILETTAETEIQRKNKKGTK